MRISVQIQVRFGFRQLRMCSEAPPGYGLGLVNINSYKIDDILVVYCWTIRVIWFVCITVQRMIHHVTCILLEFTMKHIVGSLITFKINI